MTEPVKLEAPTHPQAAADTNNAGPKVVPSAPQHRRHSVLALCLGAIVLGGVGFYLYVPGLYVVSTNDAYIDAHIVSVVPKVAAYVSALHVNDNSKFVTGKLLAELDPRDFLVAVDSAKADLESAKANASNIETQKIEQQAVIAQNAATVTGDQSALDFSKQELQRYGSLAHSGFGSDQRYQQAQSDIGQKQAILQRDGALLEASRAHLAVLETQHQQTLAAIDRQEAALSQAQLNLSYTKIYATAPGSVANKTTEVGNFVQPGQVLFSAVPDALYVTANYKETELTNVRPGQAVTIRVDAFPSSRLQGHVDSIQRGTGAQ